MVKIVSIIIGTLIYSGHQIKPAIAFATDPLPMEQQILLGDNRLFDPREGENEQNLTKILMLAGLASVAVVIGWQLSHKRPSGKPLPPLGKASKKALIDRVSPKLRRQLLRLINDPKTANRLLMGIHQHHRDRDPDWLAEKVIYDLRRGR